MLVAAVGGALGGRRGGGREQQQPPVLLMPYRDVPPPAKAEAPTSVWLAGLPPLDPGNPHTRWCEHYSDPVPPSECNSTKTLLFKYLIARGFV
jgi:hypothetical protein|eukprot:COSAG01_NODE_3181_length_6453_cov_7.178155_8_plen_93_part_00